MKIRLLFAIVFLLLLLTSCGQDSFFAPTKTPKPTATLSAAARLSGITISISDDVVLQEFAGDYSFSTGFTIHRLTINRDGTFYSKVWFDRGGTVEENGAIEIRNGMFKLVVFKDKFVDFDDLVLVRWGRRYLIELRRIDDFCRYIKNGDELERNGFGWFYSEASDRKTPIPKLGIPLLPDAQSVCP